MGYTGTPDNTDDTDATETTVNTVDKGEGEEQGRTLRLDAVEFQKGWRCECLIESS